MKRLLFLFVLLLSLEPIMSSVLVGGENLSEELLELVPAIEQTIRQGRENIWKQIEQDEPLWNFPPWLGTFFLSEYYFELKGLFILNQL